MQVILASIDPHPLVVGSWNRHSQPPVQVTVAYTDAILGGSYEVPTLHGTAFLIIPPGTQHGACLELPGQGVTPLKGGSLVTDPRRRKVGSHIYEVVMRVPLQVSQAERRLLEQLRAD